MAVDITLYRPTVYDAAKDRTSIYREGTCLSTDEKPADWDGGSALLCLNRTPARSLYMTKRTAFGGSSKWILLH